MMETNVPAVSSRRKWISLAILFFTNLLNYMDRYTVSAVLVEFSKEMCPGNLDDGCSTSEEGLIQTVFIVVYLAAAPIFGYLGDRYSRKLIMTVGVVIWALCSLASSFMPSYWYFLTVRALIAIGESSFTTIAPTVLGDLFTDEIRSMVYGIFYTAIPVGSGLGFAVGNATSYWRTGLRITPGLTFLAAILILMFLYDPPRGESEGITITKETSYVEDLKYIGGVKSFVLNTAGFTCVTFTTGTLGWYAPSYITDGISSMELPLNCCDCYDYPEWESSYKGPTGIWGPITKDDVTIYFGAVTLFGGLVGVVSGMMMSRYLRPKYEWIDPVICGVSLLVSIPFLLGGLFLCKNNLDTAFGVIFIGMCFLNTNWSVAVDMTIYVISPARRATAEAIHITLTHALGLAGAPYIVGLLADSIKPEIRRDNADYCDETVEYFAMQRAMLLTFVLLLLGGLLFLLSAKWVVMDKRAVEDEKNRTIGA